MHQTSIFVRRLRCAFGSGSANSGSATLAGLGPLERAANKRPWDVIVSNQWLGFAGMGLVAVAYVPQIIHLVKARCTAGVSAWAYLMWSVSAAILLVYAITIGDPVFIALQTYQLAAVTGIYLLSLRHKGGPCAVHCGTSAMHGPVVVAPSGKTRT